MLLVALFIITLVAFAFSVLSLGNSFTTLKKLNAILSLGTSLETYFKQLEAEQVEQRAALVSHKAAINTHIRAKQENVAYERVLAALPIEALPRA